MADGIVRQKYNKWNPVPKEIQDAVVEYYLAGNSALAASKKFGVCAYKILINRNIPMSSVEQYRNRNQDKINEIVRLYKEGKAVNSIMKIMGVGEKVVDNALMKAGVKKRTGKDYCRQSAGREQEMIALYKTGLSAADTGKQFGVCEATVLYVLRKFGVEVRRAGVWDVTKNPNYKGGVSKDKEYVKKKKNDYRNQRKDVDPLYKLTTVLRSRVHTLFRRQREQWKKNRKTCELLGADWVTVFNHIEAQFQEGMTWENHGTHGWHIDHKIPLASAKTQEELEKLFHVSNLQPLWATDNHKKGGRI